MTTHYFIGIVPPEEVFEKIEEFRLGWLMDMSSESHITLKAQPGLTSDERWIDHVRDLCGTIRPFSVTLGSPAYFNEDILYLTVQSEPLISLHRQLVHLLTPSQNEIEQYFELDGFVPHLTLVKQQYGLSKLELSGMEEAAENTLAPYPTFEATFIRIYRLTTGQNRYERLLDIPLRA
ncbi:2'-5' RNA ligase family protein [Halobacillus locisalis]|uniref:2'-5' RNA ligase family protein n=1 Tax=Halobacillus locisalis TaxID=220753 RepID=A0A838CPX1_9BACI|nr:2'-5' RNA ligase family protein [Halobacillus locisalis]MBA2174172.1 2'-5' RNA ligase family protein [Halobacillus locisalis]